MSAAWRKGGGIGTTVCGVAVLLLIEDDAKIRTAMMRALTERGHAVASQPTGMAGLRHAISMNQFAHRGTTPPGAQLRERPLMAK